MKTYQSIYLLRRLLPERIRRHNLWRRLLEHRFHDTWGAHSWYRLYRQVYRWTATPFRTFLRLNGELDLSSAAFIILFFLLLRSFSSNKHLVEWVRVSWNATHLLLWHVVILLLHCCFKCRIFTIEWLEVICERNGRVRSLNILREIINPRLGNIRRLVARNYLHLLLLIVEVVVVIHHYWSLFWVLGETHYHLPRIAFIHFWYSHVVF